VLSPAGSWQCSRLGGLVLGELLLLPGLVQRNHWLRRDDRIRIGGAEGHRDRGVSAAVVDRDDVFPVVDGAVEGPLATDGVEADGTAAVLVVAIGPYHPAEVVTGLAVGGDEVELQLLGTQSRRRSRMVWEGVAGI